MSSVNLAILNYNGRKHLEFLLPTAIREAERSQHNCRVVVVDNGSKREELDWIQTKYSSLVIWQSPKNDYLFSYNRFAEQTAAEIIIFLNNDLMLKPNFIDPLIEHFKKTKVFSVGATSRDWDDKEFTCGPAILSFQNGWYSWPYDKTKQTIHYTLFTSGGFMAVDRKKFLELEGFSEMYRPAYHEDVDLCFRAWRRGWHCIFEPKSVVLHRETASWQDHGDKRLAKIRLRSALLFQWSSLPMDKNKWLRYFSTAKLILAGFKKQDFTWLLTLLFTFRDWKNIKKTKTLVPATDHELKNLLRQLHEKPPQ